MNRCFGCPLYPLGVISRVCIPQPLQTRGCLVSRDPTYKFVPEIKRQGESLFQQQGLLQFKAPPQWLYQKIMKFKKMDVNSEQIQKLRTFLDSNCYWIHLHKCPTCREGKFYESIQNRGNDERERYPRFWYSTAKKCADNWLDYEFGRFSLNDKIIILLGKNVSHYFEKSGNTPLLKGNEKIIRLPHPSGRNRLWNQDSSLKEEIDGEIDRLFSCL